MRRIQFNFLITLLVALLQGVNAQKCSICGSDNIRPGNTDTFYNIRYFGTYSCPNLYQLGQQGKIPGYICGIIQTRLYSACQCGQDPGPSGNGGGAPFTIPPGLNVPPSFANNLNLQTPRPTPRRNPPPPRPVASPTRNPTPRPTRAPSLPPTPGPTSAPTTKRPTPGPTTRSPTEAPTGRYTRKERTATGAQKEDRFRLARQRGGNKLKDLQILYGFNRGGNRQLQDMEEEEAIVEEVAEMEQASS